jgi:hypothetical protein
LAAEDGAMTFNLTSGPKYDWVVMLTIEGRSSNMALSAVHNPA